MWEAHVPELGAASGLRASGLPARRARAAARAVASSAQSSPAARASSRRRHPHLASAARADASLCQGCASGSRPRACARLAAPLLAHSAHAQRPCLSLASAPRVQRALSRRARHAARGARRRPSRHALGRARATSPCFRARFAKRALHARPRRAPPAGACCRGRAGGRAPCALVRTLRKSRLSRRLIVSPSRWAIWRWRLLPKTRPHARACSICGGAVARVGTSVR